MGAWDATPWGNDKAVEWFEGFFEATGTDKLVEKALSQSVDPSNHEQVRAAISVFLFLGKPEVWPIGSWESTLAKAVDRLREMLRVPIVQTSSDLAWAIEKELSILQARREGKPRMKEDAGDWWTKLGE
ncbi:MAG TPA: hypothetical protein VMY42_04430 [Thermoguttaceae bacterium]|nr:hypothetical protein [Thermoguttaceae bacterium]